MKLCSKIGKDAGRNMAIFLAVVFGLCGHSPASEHRDRGYMYLSPVPGAEYVLPATDFILVRFETVNPNDIDNLDSFITVTGASSGNHPAQWTKIASDGRTVIFRISGDFSSNELVTVDLNPAKNPGASGTIDPYSYEFMTSGPMPVPPPPPPPPGSESPAGGQVLNAQAAPETEWEASPRADMTFSAENAVYEAEAEGPMILPNGVSIPGDFPAITITAHDPAGVGEGYIFIDYSGSPSYTMIMENSGAPVWYERGTAHRDFKVQRNGIITWTNFQGFDQNFNYLRSYGAVNGYNTDDHELKVLENGHYLLFGVRGQSVDMTRFVSRPTGNEYATVNETCLQEFTPEGDLIFQWRAWDNHDIRLVQYWSYDDDPRTAGSIRFTHMNSVDVDNDGHLVVSNKRVSEVTKINRDTGEVIWRLGSGQHPDDPNPDPYPDKRLTILNDPLDQFNVQHDIRVVGENRYSVFDNHHLDSNPNSRAVEYEVDPNAMTATMVWEYYGGYDSYHMGSAQRLPNGNTLINWVITSAPKVTEVQPDGNKVYEMNWSARNSKSYRVFRFPWTGVVAKPYLIVDDQTYPDSIALIFNKFGDPNVAYYKIYSDTSSPAATLFGTSTDTLMRIYSGLPNGLNYFRVTAVDTNGVESDYSNEESAVVTFTEPGQNVVLNGDFCQGQGSWTWGVGGSASATWNIENGVSHFNITNGGTQMSDIQLRQAGIRLVRGKQYVFEFDAWSDLPRFIEAKVGQDESPWTNYSNIGYSSVTPNPTHFRYPFTMQDPSDYNARVVFNAGTSNTDVYIDNVSLMTVLPGDFDFDGCVRFDDLAVLTGEWLKEESGLIADLQDNGKVDFNDFAILADSFKYPCSTTLVTEKDGKRVLVPTSDIGYNWIGNAEPYNDTGWDQIGASDCPSGIGYENNPGDAVNYTDLIAYDVGAQMSGIMTSCYIRIPFVLDIDPNALNSLTLKIRYDDGFVAYINGRVLSRDNFDAPIPPMPDWNDNADNGHADADARLLQPFIVNRIDNPEVFNALHLGDNILAIHGMNASTGSSDFLISVELHAGN